MTAASSSDDGPPGPTNPDIVAALVAPRPPGEKPFTYWAVDLASATLLLPSARPIEGLGGDGDWAEARTKEPVELARGTTPEGAAILWAFTDPEALAAWGTGPGPMTGVKVRGTDVAVLLGRYRAASVLLNPAGPGSYVLAAPDLAAALDSAPGRGQGPRPSTDHPLVGLDSRAGHRHRAQELAAGADQARRAGQQEAAVDAFEAALEAFRELGDRYHGAAVLDQLAAINAEMGRLEVARAHAERAAAIFLDLGERLRCGASLIDLGRAALGAGDLSMARAAAGAALDLLVPAPLGTPLAALLAGVVQRGQPDPGDLPAVGTPDRNGWTA